MRLSLLFYFFTLAGTLAFPAAVHPSESNALDLETREPTPAPLPEPVHLENEEGEALEKRQGQGDGSQVNSRPKRGRPDRNYEPDDSGRGYSVDWRGHDSPGWGPNDWQYFGREIGWAPYRGWRPSRRFRPPIFFARVWCHPATGAATGTTAGTWTGTNTAFLQTGTGFLGLQAVATGGTSAAPAGTGADGLTRVLAREAMVVLEVMEVVKVAEVAEAMTEPPPLPPCRHAPLYPFLPFISTALRFLRNHVNSLFAFSVLRSAGHFCFE
ncbi:hypothetical protein JCM11641_003051 [Rhodosporidiobolus odoratus]